jgi:hypothetical protein
MDKLEHFLKGFKEGKNAIEGMKSIKEDTDDLLTVVTGSDNTKVKAAYDRLVTKHGGNTLESMLSAIATQAGAGAAAGPIAALIMKVGESAGDVGNAFARGLEIANKGTVAKNVEIGYEEMTFSGTKLRNGFFWEVRSGHSLGYGYYRNGRLFAVSLTTVKRGFVGNIFRTIGVIKDPPQWSAERVW